MKEIFAAAALALASVHTATAQTIRLVSTSSNGAFGDADSGLCDISGNGRYVVYESLASNLVAGDTNGFQDIFRFDRATGTTERVSVASDDTQANAASSSPSISHDGRFVLFASDATTLDTDNAPGVTDIFLRDMELGTTAIVGLGPNGTQPAQGAFDPVISGNGEVIAFAAVSPDWVPGDANQAADVFARNLTTGVTELVSASLTAPTGDAASENPCISFDGRFVAFQSLASNLLAAHPLGNWDIFVRDLQLDVTEPVTADNNFVVGLGDSLNPTISYDGRCVAFQSLANNLVGGDLNPSSFDCFVYDRVTNVFELINLTTGGAQPLDGAAETPQISGDGRVVAFNSVSTYAPNSGGNGSSNGWAVDRVAGTITNVTYGGGPLPNGPSTVHSISEDGKVYASWTRASNLIPGDGSSPYEEDILTYELDPPCGGHEIYCTAKLNGLGCLPEICAWGTLSLTSGEPLYVTATNVISQKQGILIWSEVQAANPFFGGTLCIAAPIRRTPPQLSSGSASGDDCTGRYLYEFDASDLAPFGVSSGSTVNFQFWSRDVFIAPPLNIGLTNALSVEVLP